MRFLLYAPSGGGGGGVEGRVLKKFTGRHRPKVQPLILLYTYTIFDREKVPLLYTLY